MAADSEQASNRAAAGGNWPAARSVWPLGGAYYLRLVCGKVFAAEAGEFVIRRRMSMYRICQRCSRSCQSDFGAAEAVLVLVVAHVPGQVAVARLVEGSERDGESPLGTPSSRLSLRPGSGPASP